MQQVVVDQWKKTNATSSSGTKWKKNNATSSSGTTVEEKPMQQVMVEPWKKNQCSK